MSSYHDSLTPLRPKRTERQKSFTPKSAMNSLRQHMHPSGKGKAKRGVLADITGSSYSEVRGDSGPEVSTSQDKGPSVAARSGERSPTKQHGKTATVARSMIGSLRSLSRRAQSQSNPASPPSAYGSPTSQAMATPLPSSPVNIPAPTLKLDLGDISNMSTSFLSDVPGFEQKKELVTLTDSVDDAGMRLQTDYSRVSRECPPDTLPSADRLGHDELLADELLTMPHDDNDSSSSECSTTPGSGPGFQVDFDGIFDEPPLFERSVEGLGSPEKRENKSLKKIVSINALAGKHIKDSLRRGMRLSSASSSKVRDSSGSTMQHWQRDMEPLTHQFTALSKPGVDHSDPATGAWKNGDPFATGNDVEDWAADSPEREVLLPDCPPRYKLRTPAANAVRLHTQHASRNDTTSLADAVPQPELTPPVEDVLLGQMQARLIAARAVAVHASHPRPTSSAARLEPVSDSLELQERDTDDASTKFSSRLSSAQYDQFHAEHFLGLEECLAGDPPSSTIEQQENTPERSTRTPENDQPSTGVVMPRIPSPAQKQTGTSDTWQFSVHDWLQGGRLPATWSSQPPHYQPGSDNASLGSVPITEHRTTPQISPKTTILGHSPCMGDRLSFDVKRSNRNMRYNALSEMSNASVPEHEESAMAPVPSVASPMRHHRMLQCAGLDNRHDQDSSFPNFETAFTNSARPSPIGRVSLRGVVDHEPSSDSIESDLEQVITDHYVFQNALGDFEVVECSNSSGGEEPVLATSTTQVGECGSSSRDPCVTPTFQADELREQLGQCETDLSQIIVPSTTASATARVNVHESAADQSADESEAVGLPIEYVFRTPASGISPTNSLDDYRHLYKSYEACPSNLPENHLSSDSGDSKAKLSPPADSDGSEGGPRSQSSTIAAPSRLSDTDYRSIESKKFRVEESDDRDF